MPKHPDPNIDYNLVLKDLRSPVPKNREAAVRAFLFNLRVLAKCKIADDHEELELLLSEWIVDLSLENNEEITGAWEAAVQNMREQRSPMV
mgnify:CR=1 FL=1